MSEHLTIGALAKAAGVGVETVRYYQRRGLLRAPPRATGAIRRYAADDLRRLQFIKSAQRLGFSLDEVAQLLRLEEGTECGEARTIAQARLRQVREQLGDLARMESALAELVAECGTTQQTVRCPVIAALEASAG